MTQNIRCSSRYETGRWKPSRLPVITIRNGWEVVGARMSDMAIGDLAPKVRPDGIVIAELIPVTKIETDQ